MTQAPWSDLPLSLEHFRQPPREYGILPFWFLNGELDPDEMRRQLREFREKGMAGIILHGRYGLEMPYLGTQYLDRIKQALKEAPELGLQTWIYDEMNWPSGTADGQVLQERPDLAQRYIECVSFPVRGPWFTYLTGADSRYLDFERSTPVAAFAIDDSGQVIDLTPNLSFKDVIPWEAPAGNWRLMYIVEKRADYYIDALNPESTEAFLRVGYEPYLNGGSPDSARSLVGFYTDEPAMHYFLTGGDNPIIPWTKDMFRRFLDRNGYNLRPCLPDLFFDVGPDSARVRHDFYSTLTDFYSDAYYRQIHEWCRDHDLLFTGHLLYEELLRRMIRVEGNLFKHYEHFDVVGVDHLYPLIGNQDRPDEHVAMKVASSAAHQLRSPRLLCESFGGIFMDATMQRMKWIADWEYVLGVNLLNPHGYHYTVEGARKRDWPPSMFYQYPWWRYYTWFADYNSRLSSVLSGGRHVAKVGIIWPINTMFATYTPQRHHPLGSRTEHDFNTLTDLLLRLHYDFDYVDEDVLAGAEIEGNAVRLGDERHELLIVPPMIYLKLSTVEKLEAFVEAGGRVLGMVFLPTHAFGPEGLVDVSERIEALFGVDPRQTQETYRCERSIEAQLQDRGDGKVGFVRSYALARHLPARLQEEAGQIGVPESDKLLMEQEGLSTHYYYAPPDAARQDITDDVIEERCGVAEAMAGLMGRLITPDVTISNSDIFYLHRVKDDRDVYFFVNPTFQEQRAEISVSGVAQPFFWNLLTGEERLIAPWQEEDGRTCFELTLAPAGSALVVPQPEETARVVATNIEVEAIDEAGVRGYTDALEPYAEVQVDGRSERLSSDVERCPEPLVLDGEWEFAAEDDNALVIDHWLAAEETPGTPLEAYSSPDAETNGWTAMGPGAWSYQLPTEPNRPYPIDVWYRITFQADEVPSRLSLLIDGFAGSSWTVYVNGQPVTNESAPSGIDSQIRAVDITNLCRAGENVIAIRLTITSATDGLLDLVKLTGSFGVETSGSGERLAAPRTVLQPASWTDQGYPYYTGCGVYGRRFTLPESFAGLRVFLEPEMVDDVLEVVVNDTTAGVRLWAPYAVEITPLVKAGENTLELRVANTLVNLLEATKRPSGLAGPPRIVGRAPVSLSFTGSAVSPAGAEAQ